MPVLSEYEQALQAFLLPMVNENRLTLIDRNLAQRTRYITVVLEDIYQPQNASAVLRTCDCFGIQDVHIIENRNRYEINPEVERGAAQWLTLQRYGKSGNNTERAIGKLKADGYRIVATSPHVNDQTIRDFDLSAGKVAFMFGTEMRGLSEKAMELADEYVKIPMVGFTESFNLSVSAAIILYDLHTRLHQSAISWQLQQSEKEQIRLQWIKNSVHHIRRIERSFKKQSGF